jgi:2-hydroxychromene-2-carboxylate isomerase
VIRSFTGATYDLLETGTPERLPQTAVRPNGVQSMIDFWFSIGSTYTYLSVMRLAEIERSTGIAFRWRPFSVRQIMIEMNNIPFRTKPIKAAYMWRDIERRAAMYQVPARVPAPYPIAQWDTANRIAVLAAAEGWAPGYARETYRRWFQDGLEPGAEPNLSDPLRELAQDPMRVLERAAAPDIGEAYDAATAEARDLGIFGSPTFVVDRELFWGDDRLDDAIEWHRSGRLSP